MACRCYVSAAQVSPCSSFFALQRSRLTRACGRAQTVRMVYSGCGFEVWGRVQGVWFRAHTIDKAKQLGLVGWCMNTRHGTVKGEVQGPKLKVEQMKVWLATEGSPMSHIERCDFTDQRDNIERLEFSDFAARHR